MMHKHRRWTVAVVETADELARKLTEQDWCVCNGWTIRGREDVVFLNDATGPDGAQEYAVLRREGEDWYQIESITFSWCKLDEALGYIRECLGFGRVEASYEAEEPPPVVVTKSVTELARALGGEEAPPLHVRVTPRIETREEHVRGGAPMCCA